MSFLTRIKAWGVRSWERLSTATKLLIVLDVVAVLLVATPLLVTGTIIARRMRLTVDEDLRHHIASLRTILAWEGYYLRAEARTVARLEGIDEALRSGDAQRIGQLLAPIHGTHGLDAIYVVTADGQVLATLGQRGPDPATVVALDLVQQGLEGKNVSRPIVASGALWLAGVAPHVGPKGTVDTAFFLARRLDHDYLGGLSHNLGPHIVLIEGDLVVSSLSPDNQKNLLASGLLPSFMASEELRLHNVRLGNVPYRLLVAPLNLDLEGSPGLMVGLLQPTELIEGAIRQTVGQIVALGVLLIGVTFVLIHFLIRGVFRPLRSLMQAAEAMAAGDLSQPVRVQGTAEVEALAAAFDQMRTNLQSHIEAQRRWGQELEAQVRARTQKLEAARAFQQAIIDGVADSILVIGTDYRVRMMNRAAREFSSGVVSSESPLCYQISHQRDTPCKGPQYPCPLEQVRESGQQVTVVHEHYRAGGERRFSEIIASPLWGADGTFQGIIECIRDITERKQVEETLRRYAERLRALTAQIVEAAEAERQRVARELHDETSQALANLVVTLGTLIRLTPDVDMRQRLSQVKRQAVETLEDVKRIVLDLRPRLLDDYGLLPAIQWYVEERLGQAGVRATVEVQGSETRLPPPVETGLFRVVQEAVNNIARHAQASQAWVRITWKPEWLIIEVEDNGQGFDVQEAMSDTKSGRGLGLLGMEERVTLVGGTLTINSAPQAGTRIVIQVPLSGDGNHVEDQCIASR